MHVSYLGYNYVLKQKHTAKLGLQKGVTCYRQHASTLHNCMNRKKSITMMCQVQLLFILTNIYQQLCIHNHLYQTSEKRQTTP